MYSSGFSCDWTKGYRVKQCKGCMWLLLCCPYVRDLRSCCYCFIEICFAEIWAQYYNVLLQTKEECYDMQEKVKTIQVRQNQNQIWQKSQHLQTKWKLIIWSWCCVRITAKEIPYLWVIVRWYCEWLCGRLFLRGWSVLYVLHAIACVCLCACAYLCCMCQGQDSNVSTATFLHWQPASAHFSNHSSDHWCAILFIPY